MVEDVPTRRYCATSEVHRQLLSVDPTTARRARTSRTSPTPCRRAASRRPRRGRARSTSSCTSSTGATRQNISNAQVQSQIRILNQDFRMKNRDRTKVPDVFKPLHADTRVQFRLATKDIFGNATSGITRTRTSVPSFSFDDGVKASRTGGADPWPTRRYLNIWVCNLGDGLLGYAQFPGGPRATDGVVILHTAFGNTGTAQRAVRPRPHHDARGRPLAQPVPHLGRRRDRLPRLGQLPGHAQPGERELRRADLPARLVQQRTERRPVHELHGLRRRQGDVHVHRRARRRA